MDELDKMRQIKDELKGMDENILDGSKSYYGEKETSNNNCKDDK